MNTQTQYTIEAGDTLFSRSACDHECVFVVKVLERRGSFVRVQAMGNEKRVKVYCDRSGDEYIFALGRYSMAPIFRASRKAGSVLPI